MLKIILFLLLGFFQTVTYAQKIDYTIPPGFEKDINKDDYKMIVDVAVAIIRNRYKIEFVEAGSFQVSTGQEVQTINIHNVVLKCVAVKDRAVWKDIIHDHFHRLFASIDAKKSIDPENFETIKQFLSIRIYPKTTVLQRGGLEKIIYRTDLEDTYTLLMLDLPEAFTNVEKQMFDLWKKDIAEVFKIAQANINAHKVEKVTQKFNLDGSDVEVNFIEEENYAASYSLDLKTNSPEFVGEWGSVVSIPHKGLVNICKISKDKPLDFVKFIEGTKPIIEKSYVEHPQPVSDQYFWYYKGKFTRINISRDTNGQMTVITPLGLSELMTKEK